MYPGRLCLAFQEEMMPWSDEKWKYPQRADMFETWFLDMCEEGKELENRRKDRFVVLSSGWITQG